MYKITNDTYVRTDDYNDYVVANDGTLHAQGSHDINRNAKCYNEDGTKQAWHRGQRMRKRQYSIAVSREAGLRKVAYAQIGPRKWAVNARVDSDNNIVVCEGYTNNSPRKVSKSRAKRRSRLAQLCDG